MTNKQLLNQLINASDILEQLIDEGAPASELDEAEAARDKIYEKIIERMSKWCPSCHGKSKKSCACSTFD